MIFRSQPKMLPMYNIDNNFRERLGKYETVSQQQQPGEQHTAAMAASM